MKLRHIRLRAHGKVKRGNWFRWATKRAVLKWGDALFAGMFDAAYRGELRTTR